MLPGRVEDIAVMARQALREAQRNSGEASAMAATVAVLAGDVEQLAADFAGVAARLTTLEERFADHLEATTVPTPV